MWFIASSPWIYGMMVVVRVRGQKLEELSHLHGYDAHAKTDQAQNEHGHRLGRKHGRNRISRWIFFMLVAMVAMVMVVEIMVMDLMVVVVVAHVEILDHGRARLEQQLRHRCVLHRSLLSPPPTRASRD